MYNVVWLFIDSVRRYYSEDDRSKLKFMDEFAKESVEFKNVVTSAPSTFMSLSAMQSGMPSYFINRNFDDFKFDKDRIKNLTSDLKKAGINNYSFIMHPSTRENMINVFPMISRKYWPKGLTHKHCWSNDDINRAVDKTLEMGVDKPAFFFVDFNCRHDFETSDKVKWAHEKFKAAGFTSENTITILCSDHGYPDASKESGRPEYYTENNLTHDLILTDDNIMIPMYIQYPNCPKGKKVETTVSSIDLYPTITDLLRLPSNKNIMGRSLLPLIEGDDDSYKQMMEKRFHRTDSRLAMQTGRGTSIRNGSYKYIFYHDNIRGVGNEEFFDINTDPLEKENLVDSNDVNINKQLEVFRDEFHKSENSFVNHQMEYLFNVFKSKHDKLFQGQKNILIVDSSKELYIKIITGIIQKVNSENNISLFCVDNKKVDLDIELIDSGVSNWEDVDYSKMDSSFKNKKFDVIIIPINYSENRNNKKVIGFVNKLNGKKLFIDYNLTDYKQPLLASQLKKFRSAYPFLKQEPLYFMEYIFDKIKGGFSKLTTR